MIEYFNQTNPSKQSFLSEKWPSAVLHIVHSYFRYFSLCEVNLASCSTAVKADGLEPAMEFLEKKLSELNVSYNELGYVFGQKVAALFLLSASYSWATDDGTLQQKTINWRLVNSETY